MKSSMLALFGFGLLFNKELFEKELKDKLDFHAFRQSEVILFLITKSIFYVTAILFSYDNLSAVMM